MNEGRLLSILNVVFTDFLKDCNWKETKTEYTDAHQEIRARLKSYDKLKEGIEKLIRIKSKA